MNLLRCRATLVADSVARFSIADCSDCTSGHVTKPEMISIAVMRSLLPWAGLERMQLCDELKSSLHWVLSLESEGEIRVWFSPQIFTDD